MKLEFLLILPFALLSNTSCSQFLVKDIYTGGTGSSFGSFPTQLTDINGLLYFTPVNKDFGLELWTSNGTEAGTNMVLDVNPGLESSNPYFIWSEGNISYWSMTDGKSGYEMWKTDGTSTGTSMVMDIYPGSKYGLFPKVQGTKLGSKYIFAATDSLHGTEVWISDGSTNGTKLVKEIRSGMQGSNPSYFYNWNGKVYFSAFDGVTGALWVSDGTTTGTVILKDSFTGSPQNFIAYKNALYFSASADKTSYEPWVTDGTKKGTRILKDIYPGMGSSSPGNFIIYKSKLYFTAKEPIAGLELYVTDGTDTGTLLFKDIKPGSSHSNPRNFVIFHDSLYFVANIGIGGGSEIFRTNGEPGMTGVVLKVNTVPNDNSNPTWLYTTQYKLYFVAETGTSMNNLHESDGTLAGTRKLLAGFMDPQDNPEYLTQSGDFLFFSGYDNYGTELYAIRIANWPAGNKTIEKNGLKIYPNPAADHFSFVATRNMQGEEIQLYDALGRIVFTHTIPPDSAEMQVVRISIAELCSGIYSVQVAGTYGHIIVNK